MDCDGAHDPAYIGSMFKLIRSSEIVITNRFLIKNALSGWKLRRIIITKLRYYLIRIFLNSKLDGSGGFRLYDLKKIKLNDILEASDDNYSFFWESIFLLEKKYKITEIPIKLQARVTGSSKMETKDIFDGFILLLKIFIKHRLRIF